MWAGPFAAINGNPFLVVAFFILWSVMMGTYLHFWWRVAPAALRRWADAEGYQIVERKAGGLFDWFTFAGSNVHHIYRIVARDREGQEHRGLFRVGKPHWFCMSASRCPVEVRWGEFPDTLERFSRFADPKRLVWKGGPSSQGQATTRRTVLVFAVADLILALPLLALVLGSLLVFGLCVDEIWTDSLGLNRYLHRTPGSHSPGEPRQVMAMFFGYFILNLPILVAARSPEGSG